jgi:hypothetical protein
MERISCNWRESCNERRSVATVIDLVSTRISIFCYFATMSIVYCWGVRQSFAEISKIIQSTVAVAFQNGRFSNVFAKGKERPTGVQVLTLHVSFETNILLPAGSRIGRPLPLI